MKRIIKELRLEKITKEDLIEDLVNSTIIFVGMYLLMFL